MRTRNIAQSTEGQPVGTLDEAIKNITPPVTEVKTFPSVPLQRPELNPETWVTLSVKYIDGVMYTSEAMHCLRGTIQRDTVVTATNVAVSTVFVPQVKVVLLMDRDTHKNRPTYVSGM